MRAFLNAILAFIGSASLSDEEWDGVEVEEQEYSQEVYDELKAILEARENVSTQLQKLVYYFKAKGVDVENQDRTAQSQIFVGAKIECPR